MARKKRKADEPPPPAASTTASDTDSSFRPWADLPQDILSSIRDRFSLSAPDLLAFSAVCGSWRSAAAAAVVAASFTGPPLLLVPSATPSRGGSLRWSGPPKCRLKALTVTTRSYPSAISSGTLRKTCVGCSNGQLIFVRGKRGVVADVFTGREVHPPEFHIGDRRFAFGILTAPLSSASCLLLLVSFDSASNKFSNILCWKPGTDDWSKLELNHHAPYGISTIGVFKDRILVMDSRYHLMEVEFFPHPFWKYVQVNKPGGGVYMYFDWSDHYMVECGEELLFVSIVRNVSIEVYRLDWSGLVWVKIDGLGDWCLFIDVGRKFATACHDPLRWGGRDNCIYFAPQGSETWVVVPLDDGVMDTCRLSPLRAPHNTVFRWPSPMWVYPSMLL